MVKGDKVRLNHELLIWCGFTQHGRIWTYPDGVDVDNGVPFFPESLNEIFKRLVPKSIKLMKVNWKEKHDTVLTECGAYNDLFRDWWWGIVGGEDPALALCLAIQKLIRSEGKTNENPGNMHIDSSMPD